jgi:hypothetical protein
VIGQLQAKRTQINGKFNDVSIADEVHKNVTVQPLFKNYKKNTFIHR